MDTILDYALVTIARLGAPPIFSKAFMTLLADRPPIPANAKFPPSHFTTAYTDKNGRRMPQAIAHRGAKAKFPENTMCAFKGAVATGVHALETDIHLTKDGVVVLSHDATLARCFGVDRKLVDCDWKEMADLRTLREPHVPPPRLDELLHFLISPGLEKIWLLLDIKLDNDARSVMKLMAEAINRVPPASGTRWEDRIVLGCWAAKFVPFCHEYLPGFAITNIGFSLPYAKQFIAVPNVSFNMLQASLFSPLGRRFVREAQKRNRPVYSWTVNEEPNMDWCIRRKLDGVITDDPEKFLKYCSTWDENAKPPAWPTAVLLNMIRVNIFAWIFGLIFWGKHGFGLDRQYLQDKQE